MSESYEDEIGIELELGRLSAKRGKMNAQTKNKSNRLLFHNGGSLLALWAQGEMARQFSEMRQDEATSRKAFQAFQALAHNTVAECPCGCGLKNDICDVQAERVRQANEELPF